MCLCLGCGGVGWCSWEVVRGFESGSGVVGLCYVCVRCESGFSV